jgi:hypothetical protein
MIRRTPPSRVGRLAPDALQVVAVVALFAALGAGCGWLWFQVWDPPMGTVFEGRWYIAGEEALGRVFDGTAWYVVVGSAGAAVGGAVATLFARRSPLVTLAAVVVGSALAAWLMLRVGLALAAADPETLATTAADRTELPGRLTLEGGRSPYLVWPICSLIALMVVNFLHSSRAEIQACEGHDPRWLSRNRPG